MMRKRENSHLLSSRMLLIYHTIIPFISPMMINFELKATATCLQVHSQFNIQTGHPTKVCNEYKHKRHWLFDLIT